MKKAIATIICAGFVFSLIACFGNAAPVAVPDKNKEQAAQQKSVIPKEVKSAMEAGLAARQPMKTDIPFTISENIIMPGPPQLIYVYLLLKVKNADMGYAPAPAAIVSDPLAAVPPAKLQAKDHVFIQLYKLENGNPGPLTNEIYIPAVFESDPNGYDPEAVDWYSVGLPLPPGNYLAAIDLASNDLTKSGIQYYEFSLPDPAGFTKKLETSTILCMKEFRQVEAPDAKVELHRGLLSWSIARITPNLTKTLKVGDPLDIFFFIYGARPDSAGKFDVQVNFEVDKLSNESDIDSSKYPLLLENWEWERTSDGSSIEVKGEVKNISKEDLNNVEALVNFFDKENKYVAHTSALIENNPIATLQTSPFRVLQKDDPLIVKAVVDFKHTSGEKIDSASLVETAIKFNPEKYESPLISLPIPLKNTIETRTGDTVEYKEQNLAAGSYVLVAKILDKVSGLKGEKKLEFVIE
jgi:predicted small lipoprotein YifL